MPFRGERERWILYKHTRSLRKIEAVAQDVKFLCQSNVGVTQKLRLREYMHKQNEYNPRNKKEATLDSMVHRINTLKYWMFGHVEENDEGRRKRTEEQHFIFSPLGNLYLKYLPKKSEPNGRENLTQIFLAMLFAIQFPTTANTVSRIFNLYPFRLIFKLLRDPRLDGKLYNKEVEYLLMFVENVDSKSYEDLIAKILNIRAKSDIEMAVLFKEDEHTFVRNVYEWEYYTVGLLSEAKIFVKTEGDPICKLFHTPKTNTKSPKTGRTATNGYVEINPKLIPLCDSLLASYSPFATPIQLNDPCRMLEDSVKGIYSFYPQELLDALGESDAYKDLSELVKQIDQYSLHPDMQLADDFERVLCLGMNYFKNVRAKRMGKAGHTDIECLYTQNGATDKFDIEAKSTENKLSGINSGRLKTHRDEIGSNFTIVVTPGYVPAVKGDIQGQPIVILLASTFSEYLMNMVIEEDTLDFTDLLTLIKNNLGMDISPLVSKMTMERYGTKTATSSF